MSEYNFVGGLMSGSTEGQFASSYTNWLDGQIESHADFIAYTLFQQGGMSLEQATGLRTALQNGDFTVSDLFLAAQSKSGPLADIAGTPSPVLHVEGYDPIQLAQFMSGKELVTWTSGSGKNVVTHTREALDHFNGDDGAPQGWDHPVVIHVNEAPVVSPIEISITESQTAGGADSGSQPWDADLVTVDLLSGATDADGGALSILNLDSLPTWATLAQDGHTLIIDQNSRALDHLKVGEHDSLTLNFQVSDGQGGVVDNHITINLTGTNDGPELVVYQHPVFAKEGAGDVTVDLLGGATDADGDTLTPVTVNMTPWSSLAQDGHTLIIDQNWSGFDYLKEGEHETFYFNFGVSDGHVTNVDTVHVNMVGTNDLPTAAALHIAGTETQSVYNTAHQITNLGSDIIKIDLLSGASDVDGDALSIVQGSLNFGGNSLPLWASLDADGRSLLIDQNSRALDVLKNGETNSFAFDFKISDGHAEIGNTVTVDLTGTADQYAAHASGDTSKTFTAGGGNLNGQSLAFTLSNDGGFDFNFSGTLTATQTGLTGNEKSTIADFNSDDGFNSLVLNNGNPNESVALSDAALDDHGVTFNVNWGGSPANGDSVLVGLHWQADYWIMA